VVQTRGDSPSKESIGLALSVPDCRPVTLNNCRDPIRFLAKTESLIFEGSTRRYVVPRIGLVVVILAGSMTSRAAVIRTSQDETALDMVLRVVLGTAPN
jgi:hypothetical protein